MIVNNHFVELVTIFTHDFVAHANHYQIIVVGGFSENKISNGDTVVLLITLYGVQ